MVPKMCLGAAAAALCVLVLAGSVAQADGKASSLTQARKGHTTKLVRKERHAEPLIESPAHLLRKVSFPGPLGNMAAYVGAKPEGEGKHPAIVWITGGFPPGGIGEAAWEPVDLDNDQSAQAFRHAGMVVMYPTVRGSFGNPGHQETFFGEVDDVLAAAAYLAKLDYVDPQRIYLGGHSTGGTLALLVAAASSRFRGVFAFGAVEDPATYGDEVLTYDPANKQEGRLRAPIHFLGSIESPTWVIEGASGNAEPLSALRAASKNPKLAFVSINGGGHFDVLAPLTRLIAGRIAKLKGDATLALSATDIQGAYDEMRRAIREADDLRTLARLRRAGVDLKTPKTAVHYLLSRDASAFDEAGPAGASKGFVAGKVKQYEDQDGDPYYVLTLRKAVTLGDLPAVFASSAEVAKIAAAHDLEYDGWGID